MVGTFKGIIRLQSKLKELNSKMFKLHDEKDPYIQLLLGYSVFIMNIDQICYKLNRLRISRYNHCWPDEYNSFSLVEGTYYVAISCDTSLRLKHNICVSTSHNPCRRMTTTQRCVRRVVLRGGGCRQRRCKSSLQLLPSCHISPRNHSTLWIIHGGGGCSVLYLCILKENMNEGCKKWRAAEWLRSFCAMMFYREQFSSLLYLSLRSYSSANLHPGVGGICLLWFLFEVFEVLWRD